MPLLLFDYFHFVFVKVDLVEDRDTEQAQAMETDVRSVCVDEIVTSQVQETHDLPSDSEGIEDVNEENGSPTPEMSSLLDTTCPYPTDPALFIDKAMTPELVREILKKGPCQPGLDGQFNFPQSEDRERRAFRSTWYNRDMKNGLKSYRDWLIYSPKKNCTYCFPCWLFANRSHQYFDPAFSDPAHGFSKWRKATDKFKSHEQSSIHLEAVRQLVATNTCLKLGMAINQEQIRAHERQVAHNRKVLHRLLDVTLFLARQNLAFRGHKETRFSCMGMAPDNEGNFLELIRLLAKYDGVLGKHVASATRNQLYMSPKIQNHFIRALAEEVEDFILKEVKQAHFYGIIMDTTIDISHKDQLSFCIRYVDETLVIQERFLQLTNIKASDSPTMFQELNQLLEKHGLEIKWIRSQSYDGASNMSGILSGLQARVKELNPSAVFVHCCAHNLNLVLAHSCDD